MSAPLTPFFFGSGRRPLFGAYSPAVGGSAQRAAVLCAPWGREYLCAHRSMRQLGNQLSQAGVHVLRFDYYATGDSGGNAVDGDLSGWVDDVLTAMDELRDTSAVRKVTLVGLRLGAWLAQQASLRQARGLDSLVLWDPVVSGPQYLDELTRSVIDEDDRHQPPAARDAGVGGGLEIHGFALTERVLGQVGSVDLVSALSGQPGRVLAVLSQERPDDLEALRRALSDKGDAGQVESVPALPAWRNHADTGAGAVPVRVLQRIVQWLTT